jgi:hypothetical protein
MSKFINTDTKVVVSVADEKDDRFAQGWDKVEETKTSPRTKQTK